MSYLRVVHSCGKCVLEKSEFDQQVNSSLAIIPDEWNVSSFSGGRFLGIPL